MIDKDFPQKKIIRFLTCKHTWKFIIHGIYDKQLFDKNIAAKRVYVFYYTPYTLTLLGICLVMRNQNTHKNMKLKINKDVE